RTDVILERHALVVEIDPDESAKADLGFHFTQRRVFLAESVLVALFGARDVDAVAARVERPGVENAGQALRIPGGIVKQRVPAMRADVVEAAHGHVIAAHDEERYA